MWLDGEKRFFLVATGLHLAFIGVTKLIPPPARVLDPEPAIELTEIDLPSELPPEWREERSSSGVGTERGERAPTADARFPRTGAVITAEGPAEAGDDVAPDPADRRPDYNEGFSDPDGSDDRPFNPLYPNYAALGIGMPDVPPPAPTDAPRAERITTAKVNDLVASAIREADTKKGLVLPGASNVATTVRTAVWGSELPDETKGTIVVKLDANGKVADVRVAGTSSGSAAAWQAVAAAVKASLASNTFKLSTDFKKGAIITINVQSKIQYPSGAGPEGSFDIGVGKGSALGGSFDVSDIGAKPRKQVYAPFSVTPIK